MTTHVNLPSVLRIGAGAVSEIGTVVRELKFETPMIVTDSFLVSSGLIDTVLLHLKRAGLSASVFSETVPDPTTDSLAAGVEAFDAHRADAIIAVGGGSAIDSAKAIGALVARGGNIGELRKATVLTGEAVPVIAIPTTSGSGSEATQFCVITDSATNEKMLFTGPGFLPVAAVLDYELTLSKPARLTADTAVDALCHAIEAYVSRKSNKFSDAMALAAIKSSGAMMRRAFVDGTDREAREALMLASFQAGVAFSNSSVTLIHGMSRPIGGNFQVAHGLSNAMLLPTLTAFSIPGSTARYADISRALGASDFDVADEAANEMLVKWLVELCRDLAVPTPKSYGIERESWEEMIPTMAAQAIASGSPANNPVVPTQSDIERLYKSIYSRDAE